MPGGRPSGPGGGTPSSSSTSTTKRPAVDPIGDDGSQQIPGSGKMKLPRLDRGNEDFSSVVKNRLQSYTRTGQACDRCKVRKIRCDALPEGCSHCISLNLDCYVTDRVTGRTERRGYLQQLEREKNGMLTRIRDLEKLLRDKGIEVKPYDSPSPQEVSPDGVRAPPADLNAEGWTPIHSLWVKYRDGTLEDHSTVHFLMPNFPRSQLESRPEDTSLGVGWDSKPLSSISGTRLRIMGTTIDTASFNAPDIDEPVPDIAGNAPLYNKSVQAFLQSAMGINPAVHVELPSRGDAFTYAEWYFLIMAAYIPCLHKPSFMTTLARIYDEPGFQPAVPELVQIHMVFAIIYYQYGVRNWEDAGRRNHLNELSNKHYHFSLSKFFELLTSRELSAIQAMTLIASHTRAFPKPGCGTMVSNLAFQRAIEMNLHRSPDVPSTGTNMNIELRKRTWWVLLSVYVSVTGRRGRPMPITVEEFDVGFPEPLNDDALLEDGIDKSKADAPCEWEVGLVTMKMMPIMMEMYSNIYAVRRDKQNYQKIIYALEKELNKWEEELPDRFRLDKIEQHDQNSLAALYIKMFGEEIRLWLRHNSVNPTTDKALMAENTRICEDTARSLLRTVQKIIELKSLDTTWTQMSIYAMSLFTLLVAGWERRFETTPAQLATLRREMDEWLDVLKELSLLMGAGAGIKDSIAQIVARTIQWIENDMKKRKVTKSAPASTINSTSAPPPPPTQMAAAVRTKQEQPSVDQPLDQIPHAHPAGQAMPPGPPASAPPAINQNQHPHPPAQQPIPGQPHQQGAYYHEAGMNGHATYPALTYGDQHQNSHIGAQGYGAENNMYYANQTQQAAGGSAAHPNPLIAFASQAAHHVDPATEQMMWQRPGGNTWQDWTAAIADSQDRYGAGALLTLGNAATAAPVTRGLAGGTQTSTHDMTTQWPLVMFDQPGTQQPHHQNQQQQQPHQQPHGHHGHLHHHGGS